MQHFLMRCLINFLLPAVATLCSIIARCKPRVDLCNAIGAPVISIAMGSKQQR